MSSDVRGNSAAAPGAGRLYLGHPRSLEQAFFAFVAEHRRSGPLEPLVVFVPTAVARLHLRRELARRYEDGVPLVNVHFLSLEQLIQDCLATRWGPNCRPLPPLGERILLHRAVEETLRHSYFEAVRELPGFELALLATITDLKEAGLLPRHLRDVLDRPWQHEQEPTPSVNLEKLRALVRVWETYEELKESYGYLDEADRHREAAAHIEDWSLLVHRPITVFFGFYDLKGIQYALVEALQRHVPVYWYLPYERSSEAYAYVERTRESLRELGWTVEWVEREGLKSPSPRLLLQLQQDLFASSATPEERSGEVDGSVRIVSTVAEGPESEAVLAEAVRWLLKGTAPHRIAILVREANSSYQGIKQLAAELGVPLCDLQGSSLAERPLGKVLTGLLSLAAEEDATWRYPRAAVLELVAVAMALRQDAAARAQGAQKLAEWEQISREAGIVAGRSEWLQRLRSWGSEADTPSREAASADPNLEANQSAEELFQLIEPLLKHLDELREAPTWAAKVEALQQGLGLLCPSQHCSPELQQEIDWYLTQLAQLAPVDDGHGAASLFLRVARDLTLGPAPQEQSPRYMEGGIVLAPVMKARGGRFDVVVIPGLVEKAFPISPRQDPILLDEERSWLNEKLLLRPSLRQIPLKSWRAAEEKVLFKQAVDAADEAVVFFFPRYGSFGARPLAPSVFLLEVLRALGNPVPLYEELLTPGACKPPVCEWLSHNKAEWTEKWLLIPRDYRLRVILRNLAQYDHAAWAFLLDETPRLWTVVQAEQMKWGQRRYTLYDGYLGARVRRQCRSCLPTRLSVTGLERYCHCPYSFFLSEILGLEESYEPERLLELDRRRIGQAVHNILARFFQELTWDAQGSWESLRTRLAELCHEEFTAVQKSGAVGPPLLWDAERQRLMNSLSVFAELEWRRLQEKQRYPERFEEPFDLSGESPVEGLHLKGRIDRIDRDRDGKWYVVDYKASGSPRLDETELRSGRAAQLVGYSLAAVRLGFDHDRFGGAEYVLYNASEQEVPVRQLPIMKLDQLRQLLSQIWSVVSDHIQKGWFLQYPIACKSCCFAPICMDLQEVVFQRKQEDPRVQRLLSLLAGEPEA